MIRRESIRELNRFIYGIAYIIKHNEFTKVDHEILEKYCERFYMDLARETEGYLNQLLMEKAGIRAIRLSSEFGEMGS